MVDLPDFEEMAGIIEKIGELSSEKGRLELEIYLREAEIVATCMSDTKYFVNDKPPSMALIQSLWLRAGLDGELVQKRERLVILDSAIDVLKKKFELLKLKINVWQTVEANKRASVI